MSLLSRKASPSERSRAERPRRRRLDARSFVALVALASLLLPGVAAIILAAS
jgi:hypothetical protein